MPELSLPSYWHQFGYWNVPEDIVEDHKNKVASDQRGNIWNGFRNWKGLKQRSSEDQQAVIAEWKKWREDNGSVDFQHGGDACGACAVGMVMLALGEKVDFRTFVHAKHTLAYFPDEHKWTKMVHPWSGDAQKDGKADGKKYLRMDNANPEKLASMAQYLIPGISGKYEWINKGSGGFGSAKEAEGFLKQQIDAGIPIVVSYEKVPCMNRSNSGTGIKVQGGAGHYVVVLGYDDDHIVIADPACGAKERVPKSYVLSSPSCFLCKGAKLPQDHDGGFLAGWGRKGYKYLIVKPRKGGAPPEVAHSIPAEPVCVPREKPIEEVLAKDEKFQLPQEKMKRVQTILKRITRKDGSSVYYDGEVDGKYSGTKPAIKAFQADRSQKPDGILHRRTLAKLDEAWKEYFHREAKAEAERRAAEEAKVSPEFVHGRWSTGAAKIGDTVEIRLDVNGMKECTEIAIEIWEHDTVGKDDFIKTVKGIVQGGRVTVPVLLDKYDNEWGELGDNEFYFVASGGGAQRKFKTILDVALP